MNRIRVTNIFDDVLTEYWEYRYDEISFRRIRYFSRVNGMLLSEISDKFEFGAEMVE